MTSNSDPSLGTKLLHSRYLRGILLVVTLAISVNAIIAMASGIFEEAGQLAAVASAFATILLASLTAQYAQMTQRLAKEAESDREQKKNFVGKSNGEKLDRSAVDYTRRSGKWVITTNTLIGTRPE